MLTEDPGAPGPCISEAPSPPHPLTPPAGCEGLFPARTPLPPPPPVFLRHLRMLRIKVPVPWPVIGPSEGGGQQGPLGFLLRLFSALRRCGC